MCRFIFIAVSAFFFLSSLSYAEDVNIFADYNSDIKKPADAKATNVYNAWGENMAKLIESGYRDGVVITGAGDYADGKIRSDGVGNVMIDKYTNVGPVINKPKFNNTTVIVKKDANNNITKK